MRDNLSQAADGHPGCLQGMDYGLAGLCHDESRHLRRTSVQRIERSDIHEADVVAVTVSHALCPLPEFFTIPFKAMAGVAQLAGGHAMQDVVFLVWCGDQYRCRPHVAKYST